MFSHRYSWAWLLPVLLIAAVLGSYQLDIPLWFDERISLFIAGGAQYGPVSPADVIERVVNDDFQTPGYYVMLSAWGGVVGWSPFAARYLSLLCGLLAMGWMYRLGRDMVSPVAGISAALTLGLSAFFANYMHEMRAYILYALLAAFTVWIYWRVITARREPGVISKLLLLAGLTSVFYIHYFASLTVVMIGLYHLLFVTKNRRWWSVAGIIVLSGLLFLPWVGIVISDIVYASTNPGAVRPLALDERTIVQSILHFFSNGSLALLALVGVYSVRRNRAAGLAWFWFVIVLVAALAINAVLGVLFSIRHLMSLWPALALIAGIGVDALARRGVRPVIILGIWALTGIWNTFDPISYDDMRQPYAHLHWDALAEALRPRVQARDTVLYLLPYPAKPSLHEAVSRHYLEGLPGDYRIIQSPGLVGQDYFNENAATILSEAGRVWIGYDAGQAPDFLFELDSILIQSHVICETTADRPDLHLNMYAPLPSNPYAFTFGEGIEVTPLLGIPARAGRTLSVALGFNQIGDLNPGDYSVALHVETADGQLVAQADFGLVNEAFFCKSAVIPLHDLAAGDYRLMLTLYRWSDGERLMGVSHETGESGDRLLLKAFTIQP